MGNYGGKPFLFSWHQTLVYFANHLANFSQKRRVKLFKKEREYVIQHGI